MLYSIASGIAIILTCFGISSGWREKYMECVQENRKYHGTTYVDLLIALLIGWNLLAYIAATVVLQLSNHTKSEASDYIDDAKLFVLAVGAVFITLSVIRNIKVRKKYLTFMETQPTP